MSESIYLNEVKLIKYYARKISSFCKEHRCATCPFYADGKCNFLTSAPDLWKGIEEVKTND